LGIRSGACPHLQSKENAMMTPDSARPVFVVGSGRSGTTLVRAMLAAHSKMAVPPESHYVKFTDAYGGATRDAPDDFAGFWRTLTERRQFQDLGVDPQEVLAETERTGGKTFAGVFLAMLTVYARQTGKARPGEKTPGHYRYLDRIFRWYPGAQVVALRRDPRAVVASHLASPWVTQQIDVRGRGAPIVPRLRLFHVAQRAELWSQAYGTFLRDAERDPRIHLVSYEALVEDPETQVRAMTDFLGERFEPGMIEDRGEVPGSAARDRLGTERWRDWVREHESRASAPISRDGLEKWRSKLSPREIAVVESICGPIMDRFGYRKVGQAAVAPQAAFIAKAALRASDTEARLRNRVGRLLQR
jgi:hypothetical protein